MMPPEQLALRGLETLSKAFVCAADPGQAANLDEGGAVAGYCRGEAAGAGVNEGGVAELPYAAG